MKISNRRPHSDETKAKIGAANKGRYVGQKLSEETKAKMRIAQRARWSRYRENPQLAAERNKKISNTLKGKYTGDKASNWRGGVNQNQRTDNRKFAWRDAVLKRDNYTCQVCEDVGVFLHVDHIKAWADYPDLRFEATNGRALCRPCHYYVTFKRKMPLGSRWGISKRQVGIKDLQ